MIKLRELSKTFWVFLAGVLSIGYIVPVNAAILSSAGLPVTTVAIATGVTTFIATLAYALVVKRPWVVSSAMGINLIAAGLSTKGLTPSEILGVCVASGLLVIAFALLLSERIKALSRGIVGTAVLVVLATLLACTVIPLIWGSHDIRQSFLLFGMAAFSVYMVRHKMPYGFLIGPATGFALAQGRPASSDVNNTAYEWVAPSFGAVGSCLGVVIALAITDVLDTSTIYYLLSQGDHEQSKRRTLKSVLVSGAGTVLGGTLGTSPQVLFAENLGIKEVNGGFPTKWLGVAIAGAVMLLGFASSSVSSLSLPAIGQVATLQVAIMMGLSSWPLIWGSKEIGIPRCTPLQMWVLVAATTVTITTHSFAKGLGVVLVFFALAKVIEDKKITIKDIEWFAFALGGATLLL